MPHELLADAGFLRELAALPGVVQEKIRNGLQGFVTSPLEHPKAARLHGSAYPGSFRLRIGPFRVLGLVLGSQKLIFLTMVQKKRRSDYDQALERHENRLAAQGPQLADFLRSAKRRK